MTANVKHKSDERTTIIDIYFKYGTFLKRVLFEHVINKSKAYYEGRKAHYHSVLLDTAKDTDGGEKFKDIFAKFYSEAISGKTLKIRINSHGDQNNSNYFIINKSLLFDVRKMAIWLKTYGLKRMETDSYRLVIILNSCYSQNLIVNFGDALLSNRVNGDVTCCEITGSKDQMTGVDGDGRTITVIEKTKEEIKIEKENKNFIRRITEDFDKHKRIRWLEKNGGSKIRCFFEKEGNYIKRSKISTDYDEGEFVRYLSE